MTSRHTFSASASPVRRLMPTYRRESTRSPVTGAASVTAMTTRPTYRVVPERPTASSQNSLDVRGRDDVPGPGHRAVAATAELRKERVANDVRHRARRENRLAVLGLRADPIADVE
jgi:hypothetical protein